MKPPAATDEWECAECTLKNSANVKEKCQWCDAKRPGAAPAATPAAGGFDWAAAGIAEEGVVEEGAPAEDIAVIGGEREGERVGIADLRVGRLRGRGVPAEDGRRGRGGRRGG